MKSYGQYCGLSRAAELVGERWTLVIVRDLLVGPKRFNELRHGIPGIPSNLLTTRLRELEEAGVVERYVVDRGAAYRLTPYGRDLEPAITALGLWGARRMAEPRPGEAPTDNSLAASLLASRTDSAVEPFTVEITAGPATAHARVTSGGVEPAPGPSPDADLRLSGLGLRTLMADPAAAPELLASGEITAEGDASLLESFAAAFHAPLDRAGLSAQELIQRRRTVPRVDAASVRDDLDELVDPRL